MDSDLQPGTGDPANLPVSGVDDKPDSSAQPLDLQQILDRLNALDESLEARIARATQSTKDKRFEKIQRTVAELKDQLANEGITEAEAEKFLKVSELASERSSQPDPEDVSTDPYTDLVGGLLQSFGVAQNDPELSDAMRITDGKQRYDAVLAIVQRKATAPKPTGTDYVPEQRGQPVSQDEIALMRKNYDAEIAANRGNVEAIFQIKQKYAQKGLPGLV